MFWGKSLKDCTCKDCRYCSEIESDSRMLDDKKQVLGEHFHKWYCRKMQANEMPDNVKREWHQNRGYIIAGYEVEKWFKESCSPLMDFAICELFERSPAYR